MTNIHNKSYHVNGLNVNMLYRHIMVLTDGKPLTPDTLLAMKIKSLTVKYITYRIYSKYRKLRIETPCLTTGTWRLILNDLALK